MGIFNFLLKKKRREQEHLEKIGEHLKTSFSNVKKDMLHLHEKVEYHVINTNERLQSMEEQLRKIEMVLLTLPKQKQKIEKLIEKETEELQEEKEEPEKRGASTEEFTLKLLKSFPRAELKLFKAIHELQNSINAKHISYKSLASYLYPEKDYNSIRSTITQFILRLNAEGLVDKQRIGREAYAKLTDFGQKTVKNAKIQKIIKELEANE